MTLNKKKGFFAKKGKGSSQRLNKYSRGEKGANTRVVIPCRGKRVAGSRTKRAGRTKKKGATAKRGGDHDTGELPEHFRGGGRGALKRWTRRKRGEKLKKKKKDQGKKERFLRVVTVKTFDAVKNDNQGRFGGLVQERTLKKQTRKDEKGPERVVLKPTLGREKGKKHKIRKCD